MPDLTAAQKSTLKAFILADPTLGPMTSGPGTDYGAIAAALNAEASPAYWLWKSSVTKHEVVDSTSVDGTTFTWAGNGFITRAVGELTAWQELWNTSQAVDPSKANVRAAFSDIFSGTGNAALNRAHLLAISRRKATRAEKVLAAGTGSTAVPAVLGWEGTLGISDVGDILA